VGLDRIPQDKQRAILSEFPRLAFKTQFKGCLCNVVRQKPMTTTDNILRDFGIRYVEGFVPPNLPTSWQMRHFPNSRSTIRGTRTKTDSDY
jgi:hypothetical protein